MEEKKFLFISFVIILAIVIVGGLLLLSNLSDATKFCPLSHKLNPDMTCRIHDELNNKILIEHFDIDSNEITLSIFEDGKLIWIQHPINTLSNYNASIKKNTLAFDEKNSSNLIVNGSKFSITIIK